MDLEIYLAIQGVIEKELNCFAIRDLRYWINTQLQIIKFTDSKFYDYVSESIRGKNISKMKKSDLKEVLSSILTHRLSDCYFNQ